MPRLPPASISCSFLGTYYSRINVSLFFNLRATSALRLKFEVCKELKNHLELLPKTAYIQAESQFSAQLKFLPRSVAEIVTMTDKNRHFSRLLSSFPSLPPFLPPSLSSLPRSLFFNPFHSSLPFFLQFLPSFPPPSFPPSPNCPFSLTVALSLFRKTLFEDCPGFFNSENGVLEAPLVIQVADQVSLRSMFSSQVEFTVCFLSYECCARDCASGVAWEYLSITDSSCLLLCLRHRYSWRHRF